MSASEFYNLYRVWPGEADRRAAEKATPAQRRKLIREYYGLSNFPGRTDSELDQPPLGFIAVDVKGDKQWQASCLMCHSGTVKEKLDGRIVDSIRLGVANARLDLTTLLEDRNALMKEYPELANVPFGRKMAFKNSWKNFGEVLSSNSRGTFNLNAGVALNLVVRKPGNLELDRLALGKVFLGIAPDLGPAADIDVPAWWNTRKKDRFYASGMSPNSPRTLATSFLAVGNQPFEWVRDYGPTLMAFIDSLEAPAYVYPIDADLARKGHVLFDGTCSKCHGTYDSDGRTSYQTAILDRELIGTDPNDSNLWTPSLRRKFADSWAGDYGKGGVEVDPTGYVVPPLTGVWATAPYLHNGSVPALKDMLMIEKDSSGKWQDAARRPMLWKANFDSYDEAGVGLAVVTSRPAGLKPRTREGRMWFDASDLEHGKTNSGHSGSRFFTCRPENRLLTAEEKSLVLEYLKTL